MNSPVKYWVYPSLGLLSLLLFACNNLMVKGYKNPVDTSTKKIVAQNKQTFDLEDLGVFASNDFDGGRLNGFVKYNDSTAILIVNPENTPINNSAYYAFETWSNTSKPFYFTFQYPKGYKHRYVPKLKINGTWSIIDSTHIFKKIV